MFNAIPSLERRIIDLRSIELELNPYEKGMPRMVDSLVVDGTQCEYSSRFEKSLLHLFEQKESIFKLFDPAEVIQRSLERSQNAPKVKITFASKRNDDGVETKKALAVIPMFASCINLEEFTKILEHQNIQEGDIRYSDGLVFSSHMPVARESFKVSIDDFIPGFTLRTPVDGFGSANSFLGVTRMQCLNQLRAVAPAFRTQLKMGKHAPEKVIARFLQTFNNEEGYVCLKERLEASFHSYASLREYTNLRDLMGYYMIDKSKLDWEKACKDLDLRAGDVLQRYSISGIEQLAIKVQSRIPTELSVYDLVNYATEIGTHYSTEKGFERINKFVGELFSEEGGFDLEGSKPEEETPDALFLEAAKN